VQYVNAFNHQVTKTFMKFQNIPISNKICFFNFLLLKESWKNCIMVSTKIKQHNRFQHW